MQKFRVSLQTPDGKNKREIVVEADNETKARSEALIGRDRRSIITRIEKVENSFQNGRMKAEQEIQNMIRK